MTATMATIQCFTATPKSSAGAATGSRKRGTSTWSHVVGPPCRPRRARSFSSARVSRLLTVALVVCVRRAISRYDKPSK